MIVVGVIKKNKNIRIYIFFVILIMSLKWINMISFDLL